MNLRHGVDEKMSERIKITYPKKKFEIIKKHFEIVRISDEILLNVINPIEQGGIRIDNKEDLASVVEPPLLEVCQILYDKNIKTLMSSANKKDVERGKVYVTLDFDSLSPDNQDVAKKLGEIYMMHGSVPIRAINLDIPINSNTTVGEVRKAAIDLVEKFESQ